MDNYGSDNDDTIPDMDSQMNDSHYDIVMEFLRNNDQMKQTATRSLRQGLIPGGGAVAGGLMLGPVGGLVGGIVGSIYGFYSTPNYNGIVQQMINIEDVGKRNQLLKSIRLCLLHAGANSKNFSSVEDFQHVLYQYAENRDVRDQIWKACTDAI